MAKVKKVPQRMCVGCREMKNKKDLIRVVRTPDGEVQLDRTGKKSGRGAYICPVESCYKVAIKSKRIEKALEVSLPDDIIEAIRKELVGI
ncbi:MAG: RNase P modulator RnpM [Chitinophagales bacterium]